MFPLRLSNWKYPPFRKRTNFPSIDVFRSQKHSLHTGLRDSSTHKRTHCLLFAMDKLLTTSSQIHSLPDEIVNAVTLASTVASLQLVCSHSVFANAFPGTHKLLTKTSQILKFKSPDFIHFISGLCLCSTNLPLLFTWIYHKFHFNIPFHPTSNLSAAKIAQVYTKIGFVNQFRYTTLTFCFPRVLVLLQSSDRRMTFS